MRRAAHASEGNPSSTHWAGQAARESVAQSRAQVAALLGCVPEEIVFTSGGSEANNLALKGVFFSRGERAAHVITTQVEHPSVLETCGFLERLGARITRLPVDGTGLLDPDDVRRAIARDTLLISVIHANNEVGTIQPIEACARVAADHGIPLHTDAAQSVGKIPADVRQLDVALLSIAGHKFGAPTGVGALYVRAGTRIEPLIHGAGHESGRRAGTESALLAAGLAAACEPAADLGPMDGVRALRDEFWAALQDRFGARVVLNGHPTRRLPNTLNVSFAGHAGRDILRALAGVAASTGSACHSGSTTFSHVLAAMRIPPEIGKGAVRFSLGRDTRADEIYALVERLAFVLSGSRVAHKFSH
jgi:cysteine desulfurase